jgi:predicted O-methyltransferase YrrM
MSNNPFGISFPRSSKIYLKLYENALKLDHSKFFELVNTDFNFKNDELIKEINELAKIGQICIKKSVLMWLHGYLLYVSLDSYLKKNSGIEHINILETGTARGFSSLCMAKALKDNNVKGTIHTLDIIDNNIPIYWNCIKDEEGKHSRKDLFKNTKYYELFDYIKFYTGKTTDILKHINIDRFHFAFLDAQHDYNNLNYELNYTKEKQTVDDIIICDDYTTYHNGRQQFPGINKAIDNFTDYKKKVYYGDDGEKIRGYVYLKRT